ncbi:MAG: M23 family metallopeptidase [Reyranella sp.]|uniref:M23 family metallopeptidase n=1 Tax=Reyranella sp. TaxID=1929291 RepID=UPI003D0A56F3
MKRASLAAAIVAWLAGGLAFAGQADEEARPAEARAAEEFMLGSADEAQRLADYQIFTREIAVDSLVLDTFDAAVAEAGVPAATMLEARRAFASALDLERDIRTGDRLHVRYEQAFTAEGVAIDVGRVLWAELRTRSKGTIAIHRFRTRDQGDGFWLANAQAAVAPSMRMPLDVISISSGFGLRPDPFEQPRPLAATGKPAPMGGPKQRNGSSLPPGLPTGAVGYGKPAAPIGAVPIYMNPDGTWKMSLTKGAAPKRSSGALFMHDGVDLVAPTGTPVHAAAEGVVVGVGPNGRYGNWIQIDHAGKLFTVYGHLSSFAPGLTAGTPVSRGDVIGFVGSTGRSTGAHLHFEVQSEGKAVNPTTHPEFKAVSLRGADLERFKKQMARSLEERAREAKVAASLRR